MKDRLFYDQCCGQHQSDRVEWRDYRRALLNVPTAVRPWLLDEGSLTRHLQCASQQAFRVELLRLQWSRPHQHERTVLGLGQRDIALIRETALLVDGEPWVFARSIIPRRSLVGGNQRLRYLGNRSLGSWLFQARDMRRSQFQLARLSPASTLVPAQLQRGQALWGRRSRFEVGAKPLLVCEIFLPDFRPWPTQRRFAHR